MQHKAVVLLPTHVFIATNFQSHYQTFTDPETKMLDHFTGITKF